MGAESAVLDSSGNFPKEIPVPLKYRAKIDGNPAALPRPGPLQMYKIMLYEIIPFLGRVAADPKVLLGGWKECYTGAGSGGTSVQYAQWYEAMKLDMKGVDAMGNKAEMGFWEYSRDKAVSDARAVVDVEMFTAMAKVFAEAWEPAVRARDYGWFAKLEAGHPEQLQAIRR